MLVPNAISKVQHHSKREFDGIVFLIVFRLPYFLFRFLLVFSCFYSKENDCTSKEQTEACGLTLEVKDWDRGSLMDKAE